MTHTTAAQITSIHELGLKWRIKYFGYVSEIEMSHYRVYFVVGDGRKSFPSIRLDSPDLYGELEVRVVPRSALVARGGHKQGQYINLKQELSQVLMDSELKQLNLLDADVQQIDHRTAWKVIRLLSYLERLS